MRDAQSHAVNMLIVSSLVISSIATYPAWFITSLLLKDISESFGTTVGVLGLIQTAANTVSLVFALVLSALSIKFEAKSLMLAGLGAIVASSLGCGFAQSALMMSLFYALTGIGTAIITPMGFTLVSQHIAENNRSKVIGWFIAGSTFSGIIGLPIVGFIADRYGWRMAYLGYALPLAVLGLVLSLATIPGSHEKGAQEEGKGKLLDNYWLILSDRSACFCLVTAVLVMAAWSAADLYSAAFYRESFLLSLTATSLLLTITSLFFTVSSTFSGRFVERFGRKPLAVGAIFIAGLMVVFFTAVPNLYASMASRILASIFVSLFYNAKSNVTLDQVPQLRGTMMSLDQAAVGLGGAIGAALGGAVLMMYGYWAIGPVHGLIMVLAAIIFKTFVIDKVKS
jgi:DHA1 family inner membrane transport protein